MHPASVRTVSPLALNPRHQEAHGDPVVSVAGQFRTFQSRAAADDHSVVKFFNSCAHRPEVGRRGGDPVRLLHPQFTGVADDKIAVRQGSRYGENGDFINQVGDFLRQKCGTVEGARRRRW